MLDVHDTRGVVEPKKAVLDAGAIMEEEVRAIGRGGEFSDGEVKKSREMDLLWIDNFQLESHVGVAIFDPKSENVCFYYTKLRFYPFSFNLIFTIV